jgi:single-strand DNA-binding protein
VASFNQVTLVGNVTRDVEVKYLQSGTAVCELGLAVNEKHKDDSGQWVEDAVFVDVTLWKRTAEVAGEYLKKGSSVLIGGKLKMDQWEKDGKKFSKLKVTGLTLQMLGGQGGRGGQHSESKTDDEYPQDNPRGRQSAPQPPAGDDIPF